MSTPILFINHYANVLPTLVLSLGCTHHNYRPVLGWEPAAHWPRHTLDRRLTDRQTDSPTNKLASLWDRPNWTDLTRPGFARLYLPIVFIIFHTDIHTYIYIHPWCNGYHRRKWTRRSGFKSWTSLNILGKVCIQLFFLLLWVKSQGRLASLALVWPPIYEKENSEFKPVKLRIKYWPYVVS